MILNTKKKKGFTLGELSIVLVIIGLLLGFVIKGKALIKSANLKVDLSNLNTIDNAIFMYALTTKSLPTKYKGFVNRSGCYLATDALGSFINASAYNLKSYPEATYLLARFPDPISDGTVDTINCSVENIYSTYKNIVLMMSPKVTPADKASYGMKKEFICILEKAIDDKNPYTGKGRAWGSIYTKRTTNLG